MRLQKRDVICGEPAERIRALCQYASRHNGVLGARAVGYVLHKDEPAAQRLLDELIANGYVEPFQHHPHGGFVDDFQLTPLGGAIAKAKFTPPISRAKADIIVAGLRDRIIEINRDPDLVSIICYAYIFGSYVTGSGDVGDIDLAVQITRNPHGPKVTRDNLAEIAHDQAVKRGSSKGFEADMFALDMYAVRQLQKYSRSLSLTWADDGAFVDALVKGQVREVYTAPGIQPLKEWLLTDRMKIPQFLARHKKG